MTEYRYSGPISTVTLEGGREVTWFPGKTYSDLPPGNRYIAGLIANRVLVEVKASPKPAAPAKSTKSKAKE